MIQLKGQNTLGVWGSEGQRLWDNLTQPPAKYGMAIATVWMEPRGHTHGWVFRDTHTRTHTHAHTHTTHTHTHTKHTQHKWNVQCKWSDESHKSLCGHQAAGVRQPAVLSEQCSCVNRDSHRGVGDSGAGLQAENWNWPLKCSRDIKESCWTGLVLRLYIYFGRRGGIITISS